MLSLRRVGHGELPVLVWFLQAVEEAPALLLLGHVQEQLHDLEAVVDEITLPVVDVAEAALPHVALGSRSWEMLPGQEVRVDADDQHFFVVGAVEDGDIAPSREYFGAAPHEVVFQFLGRGRLETGHVHALRVHPAHHVADGPVLAGGVERLDDHQQAIRVLGGQARLVFTEEFDAFLQQALALVLLDGGRAIRRVEVLSEDYLLAGLHQKRLDGRRVPCRSLVLHEWTPQWDSACRPSAARF